MRTFTTSLTLTLLLAAAAPAAKAAPEDAQVARALVGSWVWTQPFGHGATMGNQLTLTGSGTYVHTSWIVGQPYQVTASGAWAYQDGWLMFRVVTSSALDPAGRPIGLAPVRILAVGSQSLRTPAGTARRVV